MSSRTLAWLTFAPSNQTQSWSETFDRMFDGTEALPSCLADEYRTLIEDAPLKASELLVPMPWWQVGQLRRQSKVTGGRGSELIVVDLPYDGEKGLQLR